jgi:hypothetical protein
MVKQFLKRILNTFRPKLDLKLTIDLVPRDLWGLSIYKMSQENGTYKKWKQLKEELKATEGDKCFICGATNNGLEAHEFWQYDDTKHVQTLDKIHHLCKMCHMIKHFGRASKTVAGQERLKKAGLTTQDLIDHFCKVNNCTVKEFERHKEEAFETHAKRGQHKWTQDLGKYKYLLKNEQTTLLTSTK